MKINSYFEFVQNLCNMLDVVFKNKTNGQHISVISDNATYEVKLIETKK